MLAINRPQKITFAEMRASGVRGVLVYCSDYRCSHHVAVRADQWPGDVRLSDLEPRFVCTACGKGGADVRPHFDWDRAGALTKGFVDYSFCLPETTQSRQHCPAKLGVICQSESAIMARRTVSNHWFVSVQALRSGHRLAPFARETKTFPTEAEAKRYAKEMLTERNKIIAGTFLSAHQPVRRIISGSELHRWIWAL